MAADHNDVLHFNNINKICRICSYLAKPKDRQPPRSITSLNPDDVLRYFCVDLSFRHRLLRLTFCCQPDATKSAVDSAGGVELTVAVRLMTGLTTIQ